MKLEKVLLNINENIQKVISEVESLKNYNYILM